MPDIFICHALADRPHALVIRATLRAHKLDVGLGERNTTDDALAPEIAAEIVGAQAVIVLWSENSVGAPRVRSEARLGAERNILVALALDESKLPFEFRAFHTDFLPEASERETHPVWLSILARIGELTNRPDLAGPTSPERRGIKAEE